MIKICKVCGKEFEAKRSDAKCCSAKCRQRMKRGSFAKKVCKNCGKDISELRNGTILCKDCADWFDQLDVSRSNDNKNDYLDAATLSDD